MNAPDWAKILHDRLPGAVGATIGSVFALLTFPPSTNTRRVRKLVGRGLERFSALPTAQLDRELLSAALTWRSGWRGVVQNLVIPASLTIAILLSNLVRDLFPGSPHQVLSCALVAGAVAGLGAWVCSRRERRFILQRAGRLQP